MPATLRIVLHIGSLGKIPEYQQGQSAKLDKKINKYFDGPVDEPLDKQLALFGNLAAYQMIDSELLSWLESIGVQPEIVSITAGATTPNGRRR